MERTTKDRILDESLIMFAEHGYKGTNLRDLAAQLGLSKSALYKHYESKEAIWNALLDKMEAYYAQRFGSMDNLPPTPDSWDAFMQMTMGMIRFTVHDPQIILPRKLLITEQFHDERVRKLATRHFLEGTANIYLHQHSAINILSHVCTGGDYKGCALEEVYRLLTASTEGLVIITAGADGMYYGRKDQPMKHLPAFRVDVRSTLGAGDTYKAGCVYALLHGMSDEETVRFAACSGVAISRFPLPLHPPTMAEVQALLTTGQTF